MYTKILVPLGGSKLAECVLPTVRWFAKVSHVEEIVILRVVESLHVRDNLERQFSPDERRHLEQDTLKSSKSYVEQIAGQLNDTGIPIKQEIIMGKPSETITKYVKEDKDIDLIIMATHGRSGVGRLIQGSTADHVLHDATVPVLLVTPHARQVE